MEPLKIKVSISRSDETLKNFEEDYQGSLSSLVDALRKIKSCTNDYLTELVNEEKNCGKPEGGQQLVSTTCGKVDAEGAEESDVDLEEDYIDSEIKELSVSRENSFSSDKRNQNGKRHLTRTRYNKRRKQ